MTFPIDRAVYRTLDPDYEGVVFVTDIDRTYLSTRFSSLRGMARIPFERAAHKRDIDGMARLLREIRRGPGKVGRDTPLFFISASPGQLRRVIERKMAVDGIDFDGTTFKDWGRIVRSGRFRRLREQVGFKLTALLTGRGHISEGASEILIGDDLEFDPLTYAIYADSLAGRIPLADLPRVLRHNGVLEMDAQSIARLRRDLRPGLGVSAVLIRLERYENPDQFIDFGPRILGCMGAFQMAVALWKLGSLSLSGVGRVASELVQRNLEPAVLANHLRDLCRRAVVTTQEAHEVGACLRRYTSLTVLGDMPDPEARWADVWQRPASRLWTPARYVGTVPAQGSSRGTRRRSGSRMGW